MTGPPIMSQTLSYQQSLAPSQLTPVTPGQYFYPQPQMLQQPVVVQQPLQQPSALTSTDYMLAVRRLLVDKRSSFKGELVEKHDQIYNCSLNQTDISSNSNKFYIIQLIKNPQAGNYGMFTAYGRTGEAGRADVKTFSSEAAGIQAFEKQFKTKTGNNWANAKNFSKQPGKYFMSEIDYTAEIKNLQNQQQPAPTNQINNTGNNNNSVMGALLGSTSNLVALPQSKLSPKVQKLLSLFSDLSMMQDTMVSLEIDTSKMPLGKLSQSQLAKASDVLDKIQLIGQNTIGQPDMRILTDLSSEYYTYVPMSFGRRTPPVINSNDMLARYRDVIDELKNMVVAIKIKESAKVGQNMLDGIYDDIKTHIREMDPNNPMYREIVKYVANTHGKTHNCKLEVLDIYEVEQFGKQEKFNQHCIPKGIGAKTLLFHGSAMVNWLSILKHDLLVDPAAVKSDVVVAGKMFGHGIYWADCVSKSWSYCRSQSSRGLSCIALAEVGLGVVDRHMQSAHITPVMLEKKGCHSTMGCGKYTSSKFPIINNTCIPNEPLIESGLKTSLIYDEFIVYNSDQQQIKYLVILKE